ncbi:MAG TPA: CAP domain-containing protein [Candidatus Acidoferrum sp.]|nr:CAP domain-containing protein [Candidatus Acidoferrum sp.]
MSRSVTRVTLIIGIPLLTLAVVAIVGSQRPHSVVATRLTSPKVAFLRPLHASVNHLARLVDDLPPTPAPQGPAAAPVGTRPAPARPAPPKPAPPPVSIVGAAGVEFSLVNQDRAANGVAGLRVSGALARVAQYRAQDMLNRGYFSHYDPATGQLAFSALMHLWGIPYSRAGENIAWSTNPSMAAINTMFMNSPEHRANILNGAYLQAGIGVAGNGAKIMVVEVFSN